jgi:hypothetical protein
VSNARICRIADVRLRQNYNMSNTADDEVAQDRRALEAIVGRSLSDDEWPVDAMPPGTRVRVVKDQAWDGPWRNVFVGTVDTTVAPQLVQSAVAVRGERQYSVTFDEPQFDADGDGPYRKAVI